MPELELTYQREPAGRVDCACAFNPASENAVWLNRAIVALLAA